MRNLPVFVLAAASAACLVACRADRARTLAAVEPPAVELAVAPVEVEAFQAGVPITGTLVSSASVDVKAETIGKITRFDKEVGDSVTAGETVVWVDPENYQLAVRQAQSAMKVAEASFERTRLLEAHARSEWERARNLVGSGGITDKDLKSAQLAGDDARAQSAVAAAQVDQARAALDLAEKRLRDTGINSPVAGVIQRKFVNKGAYVEAPTALFTVVDNGRLELDSPVPSADLAPVSGGQRVTFAVNSYPGRTFDGLVVEVAPALDTESRSGKARIRVDNAGGGLKAGMFAQGEILVGAAARAVIIPSSAVYRDDRSAKSSYVYIVSGGKAERRPVRIGRERGGRLEIVEGLKAGDALVTEQSIQLADGVRVRARG